MGRAVVAKLTDLAKNLAVAKTAAKDGAVTDLEKLSSEEKAMMGKMDAADKKDQAELDTMAKSTGKADHELKKSQSLLKMLRKKTHRKYLQVKAVKRAELAELEAASRRSKRATPRRYRRPPTKCRPSLRPWASLAVSCIEV